MSRMNIKFTNRDNSKITELNQILDKISISKDLSDREINFLNNFDTIDEDDLKDYHYLSLIDLFYLICKLQKSIICDIKDKDGKINQEVISVDYDYSNSQINLGLKHGIYRLSDNKLYKMVYQFKHDNYSLDVESEYYEKIFLDQ